MRKITVFIIIALVFSLFWWGKDDALSDLAKRWLVSSQQGNSSYEYLLGLGVTEGQSPEKIGHRIAKQQRQGMPIDFEVDFLDLEKNLLLCGYKNKDCLNLQVSHIHESKDLVDKYGFLLNRYNTFIHGGYFEEETPGEPNEYFPDYGFLFSLARLQSLQWVINPDSGKQFENEIHALRRLLSECHSLLSKMVIVAIISEKIDLAALLYQEGKIEKMNLSPLNYGEKSFSCVVKKEFLFKAPYILNESYREESKDWLSWLGFRFAIKKNMTLNLMAKMNNSWLHYYRNNPSHEKRFHYTVSWRQRIKNPIGVYMLNSSFIEYDKYKKRLVNLDKKIYLLSRVGLEEGKKGAEAGVNSDVGQPKQSRQAEFCPGTASELEVVKPCLPML